MYGSNGPVWYRGWATDSDEKVCAEVDDVLARTGTRRMVMGHTPDFKVCSSLDLPSRVLTNVFLEYRLEMRWEDYHYRHR